MWITAANLGGATSSGAAAEYDCTCMGVVLSTSDSNSTEMFLELSF
jgi:cyclopropane fatty-acyl-phospholipid synthase-like methyltransferase